ncbi:MAG: hypothetical protein K2O42_05625 [Oscillospiraceae bacterium]|nr:hypothetical protein [Oscillospiraceae bacterium]
MIDVVKACELLYQEFKQEGTAEDTFIYKILDIGQEFVIEICAADCEPLVTAPLTVNKQTGKVGGFPITRWFEQYDEKKIEVPEKYKPPKLRTKPLRGK